MLSRLKSHLYLPGRDSKVYSEIKEMQKHVKETLISRPNRAIERQLERISPQSEYRVSRVLEDTAILGIILPLALYLSPVYSLVGALEYAAAYKLEKHSDKRKKALSDKKQ
ncbi:hypothetical protein EPN87_03760 [archaeon]|nr:MAG: hypothetical protein EPN87_03760 [archaeon]